MAVHSAGAAIEESLDLPTDVMEQLADWPDYLSEALPPERDDEPANLRDDIADELADHLASAMSQELSRTGDEEAARRKVLERFGDPGQIARRLWWDSMGAKIMGQRILVGAVCVMALASLAACALVWQSLQENSRINQAILARLEAPATSEQSKSLVALEVECVSDVDPSKPAEGIEARLWGDTINPDEIVDLIRTTDASGLVRFAPIRPGQHQLTLRAPNGLRLKNQIILLPGSDHRERVVCPSKTFPLVDVSINVDWPEQFRGKDFIVLCQFWPVTPKDAEGWDWLSVDDFPAIAINTKGESVAGFQVSKQFHDDEEVRGARYPKSQIALSNAMLRLPVGRYRRLQQLLFVQLVEDEDDRDLVKVQEIARYAFGIFHDVREFKFAPEAEAKFVAMEKGPNRWTITIPGRNREEWGDVAHGFWKIEEPTE